jgi:hypothetical protein
MPKIRSLKAEYFQNESLSDSLITKVLGAGLVCSLADDEGRFKASPSLIKALVFTHDHVTERQIREGLDVLHRADFIQLYEVGGKTLGQIVNWERHQWIPSARKLNSTIPAPDMQAPDARQANAIQPPDTRHTDAERLPRAHGEERKGKEGTSLVETSSTTPRCCPSRRRQKPPRERARHDQGGRPARRA